MAKAISKGNLWGFIQSRPYATVADVRRQFELDTDEATPIHLSPGIAYIGLPSQGASVVRQLVREGRIALEYLPDVRGRVVIGLYAVHMPPRPPASRRAQSASGQTGQRRQRRGQRHSKAEPVAPSAVSASPEAG